MVLSTAYVILCVCRNQLDDEYRQLRVDLNIMRMRPSHTATAAYEHS
jgi:hypothetical protein